MAINNNGGSCFDDDERQWPEVDYNPVVADIRAENHGATTHLIGLTDAGRSFLVEQMVSEEWQWMGDALCIEAPYVQNIFNEAEEDGLNVEVA